MNGELHDTTCTKPWEMFDSSLLIISPDPKNFKHMNMVITEDNVKGFLTKIWGLFVAMLPDMKLYIPESKVLAIQKFGWKCSGKNMKKGPKKLLYLPTCFPCKKFFGICIDLYAYLIKWNHENKAPRKSSFSDILWKRLKIIEHLRTLILTLEFKMEERLVINGLEVYKNNKNKLVKIITICGRQTIIECDTYAEKWNHFFTTLTQNINLHGFDYKIPLAVNHTGWIMHMKTILWEKYSLQNFGFIKIVWVDESVSCIDFTNLCKLNQTSEPTDKKVGIMVLEYCWQRMMDLVKDLKNRTDYTILINNLENYSK
jgi:hypothetical protein